MWKVEYKSVLTGRWVESYLGNFTTERRASSAAKKEFGGRLEWRVVTKRAEEFEPKDIGLNYWS